MDIDPVTTVFDVRGGAIAPPSLLGAAALTRVEPAVCVLVVRGANGQQVVGSGWVFGNDTIVTARHVIDHAGTQSIHVRPGRQDGSGPEIRATSFIAAGQRDYGAVFVSESVAQLATISLGAPGVSVDGLDLMVCGYFESDGGAAQRTFDVKASERGELIHYAIDGEPGLSGSPVLTPDRTLAVGIHIQDNGAERIDAEVAGDLVEWARGNRPGARSLSGARHFDLAPARARDRLAEVGAPGGERLSPALSPIAEAAAPRTDVPATGTPRADADAIADGRYLGANAHFHVDLRVDAASGVLSADLCRTSGSRRHYVASFRTAPGTSAAASVPMQVVAQNEHNRRGEGTFVLDRAAGGNALVGTLGLSSRIGGLPAHAPIVFIAQFTTRARRGDRTPGHRRRTTRNA